MSGKDVLLTSVSVPVAGQRLTQTRSVVFGQRPSMPAAVHLPPVVVAVVAGLQLVEPSVQHAGVGYVQRSCT